MKKTSKKLLLLTAIMTLVVCMVFSASAIRSNYGELGLNERVSFTFEYETYDDVTDTYSGITERLVSFTPDEDGVYCIRSYNHSSGMDPYVYYYGTDYESDYIGYDDDDSDSLNFLYAVELYEGNTYYFVCTTNGEDAGTYDVEISEYCYHNDTREEGAVAPDCKPGKTATIICNDCGETISTGYEIPATHNDANDDLVCDKCKKAIAQIAKGECGAKATFEFYDSGLLKIKGTGTFDAYSIFYEVSRDAVKKVIIENGITEIPNYAFEDCDALTSISIPSSVGYIGYDAFYSCDALAAVTIPETVTSISSDTFAFCTSLKSITIPANVTYISYDAFRGCTGITAFYVATGNEYFAAESGVLYDIDKEELVCYPAASSAKEFTLPTTVEYVNSYAFANTKNLKTLKIYDYNLRFSFGDDDYDDYYNNTSVEKIVGYPYSYAEEMANNYGIAFEAINNVTYNGIKVKKAPYKTTYALQDEFSTSGMELVAVMSDGTEVELDPDRVSRDCYTFTKGGTITVTFTFKSRMATTDVKVIDPSSFTLSLATPKEVVGTYNYLYFTPTVTDDYLVTVDTEMGGYIEIGRYRSTDDNGVDSYRTIDEAGFNQDSNAKEASFRLIKGVKYRIAVSVYEDEDLKLSKIGAKVTIAFDCDHENTKDYAQQNPTCTAKGYAAGTYCSDCKKWIKGHDEIAALGHSIAASHITAPATMKANGLATGKCAVCNAVLNQATVAKIASVKLESTKIDYNGKVKKPAVIVTDANGKALVEGTDFVTIYASGRKEIGTYGVTVKFINNYSGTKELKFKIVFGTTKVSAKKSTADSITVSWTKVPSAKTYEVYSSTNGKSWKKVGTTKKTSLDVKGLKAATGYKFKVTAISAKNESTSKVVSLATALDKKVTIGAVKAGAGQFTANWKAASGVTGYEVVYSTTKKFTAKTTKTATVKKAKIKKKAVKGLSKGKYFVKVRAYKTVNGAKAYGAYSKVKTVNVK